MTALDDLLGRFERLAARAGMATDAVMRDRLSERVVAREIADTDALQQACVAHGQPLVSDLFTVFWEASPAFRPAEEIRPDLRRNSGLARSVHAVRNEFGRIRYDAYTATLATLAVATLLDRRPPVDFDRLAELAREAIATGDTATLQDAVSDAEALFDEGAGGSSIEGGEVAGAINDALTQAEADSQLCICWGYGSAELSRMSTQDRMLLTGRLRRSLLAELSTLLGRRLALNSGASSGVLISRLGELVDVECTADLSRVLTADRQRLASTNRVVRLLALRDLANGQLRGEVREELQPAGRGRVVCLVDSSHSMTRRSQGGVSREAWSKAVALSLLERAGDREVTLTLFSSKGRCQDWHFPAGRRDPAAVLAFAESSFHGGTDLAGAIDRAVGQVGKQREDRADIAVITDGEARMDPAWILQLKAAKVGLGFALRGVLIGDRPSQNLGVVCDDVLTIDQLCRPRETAAALLPRSAA